MLPSLFKVGAKWCKMRLGRAFGKRLQDPYLGAQGILSISDCDRMLYRSWPMSFSIILERKALHAEFAGFPLPLSPQCDEGCSSPCCSKASKLGKITIASVARRLGALTAANAVGNVILLSFSYIFRRQQGIALKFRQEQDIPQSFKQADITDHPR